MTTARDWLYLIAVCAAATLLHWWLYLDGFYAISWDESGRILDAHRWLENPFFYDRAWLPGYRVLVGAALYLHHDLFITPRVVSYVSGMAVIAGTGWLTHELFRSRPVTWIAVAFAAVSSQRIALSLAPLSSIIFIAVVVVSFSLLVRWFNTDARRWLYMSAVGFALAGMIRAEAWFFSALVWLSLIVMMRRDRPRMDRGDLVKVALIMGTFPLVWKLVGLYQEGGLLTWAKTAPWSFTTTELILKNPLVEFVRINAPSLNLIGLVSAIWLCRRQPAARFVTAVAGLSLLLIAAALLLVGQAQTGPSWRMTAVWGTLLIPFSAHTVWSLGRLFERHAIALAARAATVGLVCFASLQHMLHIKAASHWAFPESERRAGQYVEHLIDSGHGKVLIESFDFYHVNILTAAQHPDAFIWNSIPLRPQRRLPYVAADYDTDWAELHRLGIGYLMFKKEDIKSRLEASGKVDRLSEFGPWSIYALLPNGSG